MSQSPATAEEGRVEGYAAGWMALFKLLREGGSLSGRERNCCFLNTGDFPFADVSGVTGLDFADDGRALAAVDWDRDGALDLWTSSRTGPRVRFLRNRKSENHFVAVRLSGRSCNRDAIGARLTLELAGEQPRRLTRSLYAGDAYLSQSSKWIHFGLGASTQIERLTVHWPGGGVEEYTGLQADRRYRIVQGNPEPQLCATPASTGRLTTSTPVAPPVSERARIVLAARIPLLNLSYLDVGDRRMVIERIPGRSILINLWSRFCGPCLSELSEFAAHADRLRGAGLEIIALNVDSAAERPAAERILKKLRWPFAEGSATPELLDVLDILQRSVVNRHRPLPLPSSFLVDERFELAVVYKGPVTVSELVADAELARAEPNDIRAAAAPRGGRWYGKPNTAETVSLVRNFIERGHTSIANEYLSRVRSRAGSAVAVSSPLVGLEMQLGHALFVKDKHDEAVVALARAARIDPRRRAIFSDLGWDLAARGQLEAAIIYYQQAVKLAPMQAASHELLGATFYRVGRVDEAIDRYREALRLDPDRDSAAYNFGSILAERGSIDEAISLLRSTVRRRPQFFEAHNLLASSLARADEVEEAIEVYRVAMSLKPQNATVRYDLGLACLRLGDRQAAMTQYEALKSLGAAQADALLSEISKQRDR